MSNTSFLDFLINLLFLLIGTACIASLITLVALIGRAILLWANKRESLQTTSDVSTTESRVSLTKTDLEELLFELEREKRSVAFGFNNMSSTHKEAASLRLGKIEERIQQVRNLSVSAI